MTWRQLALAAAEALPEDSPARLAVEEVEMNNLSRLERRWSPKHKRVAALGPEFGGKLRPTGHRPKECICGSTANVSGCYCATCRGRGAKRGWCGCGGALYSDGLCFLKRRHGMLERARRMLP